MYRKFFKWRNKRQLEVINKPYPPDRSVPKCPIEVDNIYDVDELRGFSFDPGLDPFSLDRPPDDLNFGAELMYVMDNEAQLFVYDRMT